MKSELSLRRVSRSSRDRPWGIGARPSHFPTPWISFRKMLDSKILAVVPLSSQKSAALLGFLFKNPKGGGPNVAINSARCAASYISPSSSCAVKSLFGPRRSHAFNEVSI